MVVFLWYLAVILCELLKCFKRFHVIQELLMRQTHQHRGLLTKPLFGVRYESRLSLLRELPLSPDLL